MAHHQMTQFERLFVWTGGALFVASLAFAAWWYAFPLALVTPFAGWRPIAGDAVIFSAFAIHHSALARPSMKAALARLCPDRLIRSVYVWTASLLLILVCLLWRPVGGVLFQATGPLALVQVTVQLAGVLLIVLSVRAIDALELAGIRRSAGKDALQVAGPYHLVRHPLYLGWMLIVFGAAHLTGDRLMFAAVSTLYLIIAIPWEERSLEDTFGEEYRRYKRAVRWRVVPYIY